MSLSVSYFFTSGKLLPELAREINEVVGCSLVPRERRPDSAFTAFPFFGMHLDLSISINNEEEGYEDIGELVFSAYNFELNLTTNWGQAGVRPIQLPLLLSMVYLLHQQLGIRGMLVYDVQKLLAKYEGKEVEENRSDLYDSVSQTTFWGFADHLSVVEKRLPVRD